MDAKLDTYKTIDTFGKSQVDLVLMVYNGAIHEYTESKTLAQAGDTHKVRPRLERAAKFITHLYTTLDPEKGGEIAENLGRLYAYVLSLTDEVAATKEIEKFDDIINILTDLRDGWAGLREQQAQKSAEKNNPDVEQPTSMFATTA